jgi:hypothetical protein
VQLRNETKGAKNNKEIIRKRKIVHFFGAGQQRIKGNGFSSFAYPADDSLSES